MPIPFSFHWRVMLFTYPSFVWALSSGLFGIFVVERVFTAIFVLKFACSTGKKVAESQMSWVHSTVTSMTKYAGIFFVLMLSTKSRVMVEMKLALLVKA